MIKEQKLQKSKKSNYIFPTEVFYGEKSGQNHKMDHGDSVILFDGGVADPAAIIIINKRVFLDASARGGRSERG